MPLWCRSICHGCGKTLQRNASFVPKSAAANANELLLRMEIAFGLLVLVLILLGLRNRKKEKKEWVREEHFEESGVWIDKRSGERGTYGSLDEEMEANRHFIANQGKISELALAVQSFCFAQHPDFQSLSDPKIKQHLRFCKSEIAGLFELAENMLKGQVAGVTAPDFVPNELNSALKKQVLNFVFERFPRLLDLEIELIQKFDLATAHVVSKILAEIHRIKA